jgi:hypothetical protein
MASKEVYVAFSVHGSNAFITANKRIETDAPLNQRDKLTVDGMEFTITSPREGTSLRGAKKLFAVSLGTDSDIVRDPNPQAILDWFMKLRGLGWTVDAGKFAAKHKLNVLSSTPAAVAPPVAVQAASEPVQEQKPVQETAPTAATLSPTPQAPTLAPATLAQEPPTPATPTPEPATLSQEKAAVPLKVPSKSSIRLGARQIKILESLRSPLTNFPLTVDALRKEPTFAKNSRKDMLESLESLAGPHWQLITVSLGTDSDIKEILSVRPTDEPAAARQ